MVGEPLHLGWIKALGTEGGDDMPPRKIVETLSDDAHCGKERPAALLSLRRIPFLEEIPQNFREVRIQRPNGALYHLVDSAGRYSNFTGHKFSVPGRKAFAQQPQEK